MCSQPDVAPVENKPRTSFEDKPAEIRELNDRFRQGRADGRVMVTCGVMELGADAVGAVLALIRTFDAFDQGCDPYHEHDFGSLQYGAEQIFWKIDYYCDKRLEFGSPNPADPDVTTRVMTVMLASEY